MDMLSQQSQLPVTPAVAGRGLDERTAAAGKTVVHRLAPLFAREPELILAYLECPNQDPAADADTVWSAVGEALSARPTYADLHYFAARAALRFDRAGQAETLLEEALALNPRYNDALILMARVRLARNDQESALSHLRRALANGADYADVHVMLGDIWRRRGEVASARQAYTRALDLNADLPAARDGLAALPLPSQGGGADELPA